MDNYLNLYWLTRLDNIITFFGVSLLLLILALVSFLIVLGIYSDENEEIYERILAFGIKYRKLYITIITILILGKIFIPTKDEVIFIVAGGKTLDYVQTDTNLVKIPGQTSELITKYLDEKIKELNK